MAITSLFTNIQLDSGITWGSTNKSDSWASVEANGGSPTYLLGPVQGNQSQSTSVRTSSAVEKVHMGTWVTNPAPEEVEILLDSNFVFRIHGYQDANTFNTYVFVKMSIITEDSSNILTFDRTLCDWAAVQIEDTDEELSNNAASHYPMGGYSGNGMAYHCRITSPNNTTLAAGERIAIEVGFDKRANKSGDIVFEFGSDPDTPDDDTLSAGSMGLGSYGSAVLMPINFSTIPYSNQWGDHHHYEIEIPSYTGTNLISWADIGNDWSSAKWEDSSNPAAHYVTRSGGEITGQFWTFQDDDFVYFSTNSIIDGCIQPSDHHTIYFGVRTDWQDTFTSTIDDWLFRRDIVESQSDDAGIPIFPVAQGDNTDRGNYILRGGSTNTYPEGLEIPSWNTSTTSLTFDENSPNVEWVEGTDYRFGGPGATQTAPHGSSGSYSEFKIRKSKMGWNGTDAVAIMINFNCDVQGNGNTLWPIMLGNQVDKSDWNFQTIEYLTTDGKTAASQTTAQAMDLRPLMSIHAHPPFSPFKTGEITFGINANEDYIKFKNTLASIDYNTQLEKALAQYKITSESISLLTNLDYNASVSFQEALSFILSLAQEESNNKTSNLNIDLQGTLDFLFSNLLTGAKSITLGTLLDTIIATNKITAESQSFDTTLDFDAIGGKSVAGTSTFGINTTYSVNNYKAILAQMNVDIVLSDEESISMILAEAISFSYTLTFAEDLTGVGILDDPIYSAGNYIFVDLANVLASGTGIVTGSITFTTQLGEEKSIGLVGQAAVTLLTQLAEQSSAAKLTTEAETFAISLDQSLDFARLLSFSAGLDLEVLPTASTNALKSIVYAISNDISVSNVKETDKVLTFTTQLNEQLLKQLTSNLSIDFSTSLDHVLAVQADLNNAITFLTELDVAYRSGEDEFVTFTVNMLKTEQVQQILNPTLTLLTNLTQVEQKAVITSETITFLSNLLTEQAGNVGIFGVITLAAQFEQIETKTLTIDKAFELIINLADNVGIQLDKVETITLLLQLADTFDNVRSKPASLLFNTSLDMSATNLLDKLAAIALLSTFDQNQEVQIDFNVAITFANILSELMIGNATGAIDAVISFAVQMQKDNVGISTLFDNISFESLADLTGVAGRDLLESISITAQFDELGEYTLSQDGAVTFQTFYNKIDATRMDYRPSIDFDLQAIETSTNNKNTLATMLLGIESDLITESNRTLPIIINYGLTQNLETDISLVAEGTVTMTTAMEESSTLQMLGQAGITFGHILGLSALANADMPKSISFGTITDFAVEGFTLQFTVSTPEGRVLKIYFEDRITIVDEENRVVKVYKKPSTIIN